MDIENFIILNEVLGKGGTRVEVRSNFEAKKPEKAPPVKWASYRIKGTFLHAYDLRLFPFDVQHLPLKFAHKYKNGEKVQLVVDREALDEEPLKDIYPLEWDYLGREDFAGTFNFTSSFGNPTYRKGEKQNPYALYTVNIVVRRQIHPYYVTLFLPLVLLLGVSMLVLCIPLEQFAPRNSMVMTAFLGILVYHIAAARSLPQVGYLTRTDLLFGVADLLIFLLVIEVNVVNRLFHLKHVAAAKWIDRAAVFTFLPISLVAYAAIVIEATMAA
jgi:hypothetical protein